jgi:hypothetical protein
LSLNGTLSTQLTRGYDENADLKTRENLASLQANWRLSPRSTFFVGTRYQFQTSVNVAFLGSEASEFAVFVGLFHRL